MYLSYYFLYLNLCLLHIGVGFGHWLCFLNPLLFFSVMLRYHPLSLLVAGIDCSRGKIMKPEEISAGATQPLQYIVAYHNGKVSEDTNIGTSWYNEANAKFWIPTPINLYETRTHSHMTNLKSLWFSPNGVFIRLKTRSTFFQHFSVVQTMC